MKAGELNELLTWATVGQAEKIKAVIQHGSVKAAAKALGLHRANVDRAVQAAKMQAALKGYSPAHYMTKTVPEAYLVKGVSTYFDKEGKPKGQWVKSTLYQDKARAIQKAAIQALAEEIKGLSPVMDSPKACLDDLLVVYPLGDPHFGMYAWAKEAGDDFDLEIARQLTLGAVDRLVSTAPKAKTAIVLPLGDVFHMDDQTNLTPGHGNQLDADGRFVKVLQVGIQTFRHVVLRALERHEKVIVRFVQGNHDPHAVWALSLSISAYFENEPRVEVDLSPSKFWFYEFGNVLLGATHGDTVKHEKLLGVMAADQAEAWGTTKHRYWYTGHVHNQVVTELPGVVCESFRTLAAKDAYAAGAGYRAGRDMRAIVHHRQFGEVERHRCDIAMLETLNGA